MTATRPAPPSALVAQLSRFIVIGVVSALVDYSIYQGLYHAGLWPSLAKAISFICGTTTAYLLNKRYTFSATDGAARMAGFMALYGTTFAINVGTNALMLAVLSPHLALRVSVAWLIAQGLATAINFVMLRTVVFREPARPAPDRR